MYTYHFYDGNKYSISRKSIVGVFTTVVVRGSIQVSLPPTFHTSPRHQYGFLSSTKLNYQQRNFHTLEGIEIKFSYSSVVLKITLKQRISSSFNERSFKRL